MLFGLIEKTANPSGTLRREYALFPDLETREKRRRALQNSAMSFFREVRGNSRLALI
jgi:hypothetical protein